MKFKKYISIFFIAIAIFCSKFSRAQQDSVLLDEVIVTATRKSDLVKDLPYSIILFKRKDAEKQLSRTLPESLNGLAGIFIQKTNHGGGSPFVRGLTGNQTLLMVDGIRLNNSLFRYGPNQYLTLIDNLLVEKVEVVKGTGSVQFGSDAMTGVVNVMTHNPEFSNISRLKGLITSRFTGFGMEKTIRPELSFSSKKIAFVGGVSNKNFGDLRGGQKTGFQRPSGYKEFAWDLKANIDLGADWLLTASYQNLVQNNVPVYHKYILENFAINNADPLSRGFGYIKLKKDFNSRLFNKLVAFVSTQIIEEHRSSRKNGSQVLRLEDDKAATISGGLDIYSNISSIWSSNSGVEIYADKINSKRVDFDISTNQGISKRGLYPDGATYKNGALYSLHHLKFNRLKIEAGGRYNYYSIGINEVSLGKISIKPNALVFQAGIGYKISDVFNVFTNVSSGYRAPNIDDMGTLGIVDFRYEIPSYDLKPEKSLNQEAGLKWNSKKISGTFSVFNTSLSNLISRIKTGAAMNGYDVYTKLNVEKGFIKGWELQNLLYATKYLSFHVSATSLYGQSITKNEPLRRIPPFNGQVGLQYRKDIYRIGFILDLAAAQRRLAQGDKDDSRIQAGGTPGYKTLNIYGGIDHKKFGLNIYLNNIFNADYRTHGSGINGIGRSISLMGMIKIN